MDMFTKEELESPRTPSELKQYVTLVFDKIKQNEDLIKDARLKKGLSRYFIQELYPLSLFSSWQYPEDDVFIRLQVGNQGYDGIITDEDDDLLFHVEITWPIDGKYENHQAELLNEKGRSEIHTGIPSEDRTLIIKRIIENARKKAMIDYGKAILLIVLDLWPAFFINDEATEKDIAKLIKELLAT